MARRMHRLRLGILVAALPLALWLFVPVLSDGAPLTSRIDQKKAQIDKVKGKERVLTTTISGYTKRITALQGDISVLQDRQTRIQTDLDAKRAELARIQDRLRQERIRLVKLRARLAESRAALAQRLRAIYMADEPDIVTVILESDGFKDLLTRAEFMQRVSHQDARIIERVRTAKAEAVAAEKRLNELETEQRKVTALVDARLREVAAVKGTLVERRDDYAAVRSVKANALASTRDHRHDLEGDLKEL
jgi:peptidoglycan hydrolase CwlO-like protein